MKGGKESPYRDRSVEENLDLFRRMKAGEFPDGARTLRAKIDMSHPNFNLRDPVMYRILHAEHHRTGDKWCIYPMYDYAHGQSDSIEGITHSICTLEFENHRPLYDWYIEAIGIYAPQQIEFARLNLTYTVMSKRRADPTGAGEARQRLGRSADADDLRRAPPRLHARGDAQVLRAHRRLEVRRRHRHVLARRRLREDLNKRAPRVMGVLRPLQGRDRELPRRPDRGDGRGQQPGRRRGRARGRCRSREVLYIEQDDFRENPPKDFFRLAPGREVRLRYAYFVKCTGVVKDRRPARWSRCAAPTTRPRAAATPPTAAR